MPLTLPKISRTGTTPSRKRFWDNAREAIYGLQKVAGRHVTVDEHKGKGSIINTEDTAGRRGGTFVSPTGACCIDGECSINTAAGCYTVGGVYLGDGTDCDGIDCTQGACCADGNCSVTTLGECSGHFLGYGTTCDGVDCTQGACCADGNCSVQNRDDCTASGGIYAGDGTNCADTDCANFADLCSDCSSYFSAFDGSGRRFLQYHRTISATSHRHEYNNCAAPNNSDVTVDANGSANFEQHYAADCSLVTDDDTSSSDATITFNGTVTFSCSVGNMGCFCNVNIDNNLCTSFIAGYEDCQNCSSPPYNDSTVTTAETRIRTVDFSPGSCSAPCFSCANCLDVCDVTGTYIVTETLSAEC